MDGLYILRDREPVPASSVADWGQWFKDDDRRRVALTAWDRDGARVALVSTVFLGTDYGFGLRARPILFETMIFAAMFPELDESQDRYCAWADAVEGHRLAVAEVAAILGPPTTDEEA